jgi:hypothetical protein
MKFKKLATSLLPTSFIIFLCGCVPLKEVGAFSACSQNTLLGLHYTYGYYEYCSDSCYVFNKAAKYLKDVECDCKRDTVLDTLLKKEFAIIGAYYAGLTKLSGGSGINFAPIGKSISAGTYAGITISSTEESVFNKLSTVATNLITLNYKTNKIKEIITEYDKSVQESLGMLALHMDNLESKIKLMNTFYGTQANVLLKSAGESERWLIIATYKQKSKQFADDAKIYNNFQRTIKIVIKGDSLLSANIGNLKDETFKKKILDIAGDISYLNSNTKN